MPGTRGHDRSASLLTPAPWLPLPRGARAGALAFALLAAALAAWAAPAAAEEQAASGGLPLGASRRWHLVEPLGPSPSPWIALSGVYDLGISVDGDTSWTAVRVHIPVARHYGAVDARLVATWDDEGLDEIGPEITLRGVPLRLAEGRGALGFSIAAFPRMAGIDPLLTVGGGLMGGYLGERWFARAFVGAQGEVLQRQGGVEILGTVAAGLRLPHGLRPQVELDVTWDTRHGDEVRLVVRPGLRYWPVEWLGLGLSADVWALGQDVETSALRFDLVAHAME